MAPESDDVLVPYAVFAERRARRQRIASTSPEPGGIDTGVQTPTAAGALAPAADARIAVERRPAAGEKGDGL
jgi:hypothetical protein